MARQSKPSERKKAGFQARVQATATQAEGLYARIASLHRNIKSTQLAIEASCQVAHQAHLRAIKGRQQAEQFSARTRQKRGRPAAGDGDDKGPACRNDQNGHRIFVIGGSAGAVEAASKLVAALPHDFPGAVFVVIHSSAPGPGRLWQLLGRRATLPVVLPRDGTRFSPGHIYVAPAGTHMTLGDGRIRLHGGPAENRHRPAIDPLFRTAARNHNRAVVGVILTGYLDDGAAGLMSIKRAGGVAVVQDPDDAAVSGMPRTALQYVKADYCVPLAEMPALLDRLARPKPKGNPHPQVRPTDERSEAEPSSYTCPACGSPLLEVEDGGALHFRCRLGHTYSGDSMLEDQNDAAERALWAALRALEENAAFAARLQDRARTARQEHIARQYREMALVARANAEVLRRVLSDGGWRSDTEPQVQTA